MRWHPIIGAADSHLSGGFGHEVELDCGQRPSRFFLLPNIVERSFLRFEFDSIGVVRQHGDGMLAGRQLGMEVCIGAELTERLSVDGDVGKDSAHPFVAINIDACDLRPGFELL